MTFTALINVPGYLPWSDDPPEFDTTREAWDYLATGRKEYEDETAQAASDAEAVGYSATVNVLELLAQGEFENAGDLGHNIDPIQGVGTVYGDTPGYDGDHDLGLAYTVAEVVE